MRISVVIPTYNRRHTLERALRSVYRQSSMADEVILVDDGSADGSHAMVAREFPRVKIVRQENLGVSAARNRGIEAAAGEWIALLDSDDSWLADKIEHIREAHRQQPDFVLYHSDEIWIRRGVRVNPKDRHRKYGGWIFEHCLPLCAISPSAAVIRKSVLLDLGLFDARLPACEDYDLWLRLCLRYPVYYLDRALIVKFGGHADQLSRKYPAMDQFRARALQRLLAVEDLSTEQHAAATAMLTAKLEILIKGAIKHGNQQLLDEFVPLHEQWCNAAPAVAPC